MEVFVSGRAHWFEAEIIADTQAHTGEISERPISVRASGAGNVEAGPEVRAGEDRDIDASPDSAVTEGLSGMVLPVQAAADDEHGSPLDEVATGRQGRVRAHK